MGFRDKNRYKIDNVVAEMMGLNPEEKTTREMLNEYRKLFCNEPSVNGRQQSIIKAVTEYYNEE